MSLTLVIAEKPSVAGDIARALGGFKKDGDFWVGENMMIGAAVGHLLEMTAPEEFEVKRGKWTFAHLPVLPPYFALKPIARSKERFSSLRTKLRSRAVTDVINACDAGREGELIFRNLMEAAFEGKKQKPIRRLWLQSMTKNSIIEAFQHLRSDEEMKPLEAAARCRSEADWLVGINGTRALTAFNSSEGGFYLTTVGRVQTPTLAVVVRREEEISAFVPRAYWEVHARFGCGQGEYEGTWFRPDFQKTNDPEDRADRHWSFPDAERIVALCSGKTGVVTEKKKRTRQLSPLLFDLTSLQREANARFGFSAKTTLSLAQALYEKHKVVTYPRTDSRALPEDYPETVRETLGKLPLVSSQYAPFAEAILRENWVKADRRIFDNSKISDHFAIIPTGEAPKTLSEAETKLYDLIVRRFLSVFYPAAEYDVTTRITVVEGESFRSEGKILVSPGWLLVRGSLPKSSKGELPAVSEGETVQTLAVETVAEATRPPVRYTEATLLSAMEGAGKKLEDDELRDAMAEKGLGTPATRASIIEGLIEQKYLRREERELVPTPKAFQLFTLLRGLKLEQLSEPRLTAEWEQKLALIERGQFEAKQFMDDIRQLTASIVEVARRYEGTSVPMINPIHIQTPCPVCGGEVVETYRRFACTNPSCYFSISKYPASRVFSAEEVETLLSTGRVGPLTGFVSRRGFLFDAEIMLAKDSETDQLQLRFDFEENERESRDEDAIQAAPVVGICPICGGTVRAFENAFECENALKDRKKCSLRVSRTILQREVTEEEAKILFAQKQTPVLSGFVSKRTGRPFKAILKVHSKKGVEFEFPKAEDGKDDGGKTKTAKSKAASKAADADTEKGTAATTARSPRKRTKKEA